MHASGARVQIHARLNDDEKRLLALICRSYLAAMMPDYEYRQKGGDHTRSGARSNAGRVHQKIESTVHDLGVEVDDALEIAERIEV